MDIVLQKAEPGQLELLLEMNLALMEAERYDRPLSRESLRERWESFLSDERFAVFLFMLNGRIAGYSVIHVNDEPKYIRHFYIKSDYRGQGAGRAAFEELLLELKADEIDLDVMAWNGGGVAFWKSLGFKERTLGLNFKRSVREQERFKAPLGSEIEQIRYKSFFSQGRVLIEIITVYLNFTNGEWYRVVISDGLSTFESCEEPALSGENEVKADDFYCPISLFEQTDLSLSGKLQSIEELLWQGHKDESCGYLLSFDNETTLYIVEIDDVMFIRREIEQELFENSVRKRLS